MNNLRESVSGVSLDEVDEMLVLAERHGFRLAEPPLDALDVRFRARRAESESYGVAR